MKRFVAVIVMMSTLGVGGVGAQDWTLLAGLLKNIPGLGGVDIENIINNAKTAATLYQIYGQTTQVLALMQDAAKALDSGDWDTFFAATGEAGFALLTVDNLMQDPNIAKALQGVATVNVQDGAGTITTKTDPTLTLQNMGQGLVAIGSAKTRIKALDLRVKSLASAQSQALKDMTSLKNPQQILEKQAQIAALAKNETTSEAEKAKLGGAVYQLRSAYIDNLNTLVSEQLKVDSTVTGKAFENTQYDTDQYNAELWKLTPDTEKLGAGQ